MDNSGANTVILVLVLIVVLGGIFWLFGNNGAGDPADGNIDVNVDLPAGGTGGTGTGGTGTGTN